jgi:acyl-CoA reductase-like NAD-dependent aldehyde dehydrogenase
MDQAGLDQILDDQRRFFATGATRDRSFRKRALADLRQTIFDHEQEIYDALQADLAKGPTESYLSELLVVLREIHVAGRNLRRWMKPRRNGLPAYLWPGRGYVVPEPLGSVLVIAPWNFPFQLALTPLVGALAAGNCCVVKPSELTPHTSQIVRRVTEQAFDRSLVATVEGGVDVSQALLKQKFDHIFFTGSPRVGRIVAAAAAEQLTPATLELGGKNPCVVAADVPIEVVARRLAFGKYLNAGQTCVAPDYALVQRDVVDELIAALERAVEAMYGQDPITSPDFARIAHRQHFDHLTGLLGEGRIVYGGVTDAEQLYVAPTAICDIPADGRLLHEEIFGPLLPIVPFDTLDEAVAFIAARPEPLALYVFSRSAEIQQRIGGATASGALCINDLVVHFNAETLPFGGVGASGYGSYHGAHSFETFSHMRAVMKRPFMRGFPVRYPPYHKRGWWLRWLKRLFT